MCKAALRICSIRCCVLQGNLVNNAHAGSADQYRVQGCQGLPCLWPLLCVIVLHLNEAVCRLLHSFPNCVPSSWVQCMHCTRNFPHEHCRAFSSFIYFFFSIYIYFLQIFFIFFWVQSGAGSSLNLHHFNALPRSTATVVFTYSPVCTM